jgi:hypothetical protein
VFASGLTKLDAATDARDVAFSQSIGFTSYDGSDPVVEAIVLSGFSLYVAADLARDVGARPHASTVASTLWFAQNHRVGSRRAPISLTEKGRPKAAAFISTFSRAS